LVEAVGGDWRLARLVLDPLSGSGRKVYGSVGRTRSMRLMLAFTRILADNGAGRTFGVASREPWEPPEKRAV
jgi:hypothetical protein